MIDVQTAHQAQTNLRTIVTLWPELRARLRRTSGSPFDVKVTSSNTPGLVLDIHILDLMTEIENEAASLAHVLHDETTDADGQPWTTPLAGIQLLADIAENHYGHWAASSDHRVALAFCDWAHDYASKVRAAIERPAPPTYMGDCPTRYDIGGCGGSLYLRPGKSDMRCSECGETTTLDQQRDYIAGQLATRLYSQTETRRALLVLGHDVPYDTIKKWVRRGKMVEVEDGLYPFAGAIALAEEWAERKGKAA